MKKKIIVIIFVVILMIGVFFLGRQVGLNTEESNTQTIITEETVIAHDIQKTLTGSGQVQAKTTEELELSTSKYFKAMCVEEGDALSEGDKILKYSNGTYLTAPYDCVISSYNVPGTGSKCTSSNYVEVYNTETLTTTISVSENEIDTVEVGQEVDIVLTADESKEYTGEITKIDSIGSYSSSGTTFSATVEFENDGNVKIGMSLSCTIILQEEKEVVCVPIEAVYENSQGEEYVNKINEDGTIEEVVIETGIADDNYVQVLSGLELDEKVQVITEITESTSSSSSEESGMQGSGGMSNGKDMESQRENGKGIQGGEMPSMGSGNAPSGMQSGNQGGNK